jgi:hypothetical protein
MKDKIKYWIFDIGFSLLVVGAIYIILRAFSLL